MLRACRFCLLLLILFPAGTLRAAEGLRGWTRGHFRLRYALEQTDDGPRARSVRVILRNQTAMQRHPSARLRDHEDAHRRINEAAARDMETRLAALPLPAQPGRPGLKKAEAALRAEFRRLVEETEKLHQAWDATHTVP